MSDESRIERRKQEQEEEDSGVPIGTILALAGVLFILAIVGYVIVVGTDTASTDVEIEHWEGVSAADADDPTLVASGDGDAPVTVVYYGDFQCGHCKSFELENFPNLRDEYVATGDVRFVFKAVNGQDGAGNAWDRNSGNAAMGARCVWNQNRSAYWSYHNAVFQASTTPQEQWATPGQLADLAEQAGVNDPGDVEACIEEGRYEQDYNEALDEHDTAMAQPSPTPLFVVDGEEVVPGNDYAGLTSAIDDALAAGDDGAGGADGNATDGSTDGDAEAASA